MIDWREEKKRRALVMATNRGKASIKWHVNNTLTKETFVEFRKLMKETDKRTKASGYKDLDY